MKLSFFQKLRLKLQSFGANVDLTEGSILKGLISFAIPLLLSNFLQTLYSSADLAIVGHFESNEAMAAVGSTGSLTSLLINFFLGLSTGASVVIAQHFGAREDTQVKKAVHTAVLLSCISGAIITALGVLFVPSLLKLMGTPENILADAVTYLSVIFMGIIPTIVYNMTAAILRAVGDSRRPLYYLIISILLNIVLDVLFVAVFHWGVAGAAAATIASQTLSMLLSLITLSRADACYRLSFRELKLDIPIMLRIVGIGVPTGIQSTMFSISNVAIQSQINSFGSTVVGGLSAAGRVDGFIFMFIQAVSLSMLTFVGQNMGANKPDRVTKGVRTGILLGAGSCLVVGVTVRLIGRWMLSIFTTDPLAIEHGLKMVTVMGFTYWIFAISEALNNSMRGAGYSTVPMIVSLICICGVRLLWLAIGLSFWHDVWIVCLSYPISWFVTLVVTFFIYISKHWMKRYCKLHPEFGSKES